MNLHCSIVPVTKGGKLFATVYILVAGTILLNNMSTISMIPLELRKQRLERAVLTQFGDQLDDAALRELATGPVIQRLHLSAKRPDGLEECTREMFSLAMLVRLGKVTEQEIRETFAAFRKLDVNDEGVLNSKSIIAGMIQKRRSLYSSVRSSRSRRRRRQRSLSPPQPPISVQQGVGEFFQPQYHQSQPQCSMPTPPGAAPVDIPPPPPPPLTAEFSMTGQQQPMNAPYWGLHPESGAPSDINMATMPIGTGYPGPTPAQVYALNQCRLGHNMSTSRSNSGDESYYSTGSSRASAPP